MTTIPRSVLVFGICVLTLSGCASLLGNKLQQDADELKSALAGEPVLRDSHI
jgi:uncharacterized protein YceK